MQPEATNRPPSGTIQRRTGATDNSPATVRGEHRGPGKSGFDLLVWERQRAGQVPSKM